MICSVEGCGRRRYGRGWCSLHWSRWHRTGDPQADIPPRGERRNGMRHCSRCKTWQPPTGFHRNRAAKDGYDGVCKACVTARRAERATERKAVRDAWRAKNADRVRRQKRESYERHKAAALSRNRAWRAANPDRVAMHIRAQNAARYAREKGAPGEVTVEQIAARWAYYGGRCWMCGAEATDTDHVKPLAAGGSNWPANLRPACAPCNRAKSDSWPLAA